MAIGILLALGVASATPTPILQYFPVAGRGAPYSTAVRYGDTLYRSGQTGERADGSLPDGFDAQAKQAMENVVAVLKSRGRSWNDVFKCTVMLENMADWPKFNSIYVPYFAKDRLPARSAIGADGLAGGALIELECWARARD